MAYPRSTVIQSVAAVVVVAAFVAFAVVAPNRHQMGERFMMLGSLGTIVNLVHNLRQKKNEASGGPPGENAS